MSVKLRCLVFHLVNEITTQQLCFISPN
uniref:Uncharacterized protein n=1 Tax=Anguilla anguilla TaxID=7936 RepID=A0A0E9PQU1_ANGAN